MKLLKTAKTKPLIQNGNSSKSSSKASTSKSSEDELPKNLQKLDISPEKLENQTSKISSSDKGESSKCRKNLMDITPEKEPEEEKEPKKEEEPEEEKEPKKEEEPEEEKEPKKEEEPEEEKEPKEEEKPKEEKEPMNAEESEEQNDEKMEIVPSETTPNLEKNDDENMEQSENDDGAGTSKRKSLRRKVKVVQERVQDFENEVESSDSNENDDGTLKKRKKSKANSGIAKKQKGSTKSEDETGTCAICYQTIAEGRIRIYSGHHNDAVDECVALMREEFMLFTGQEDSVCEADSRPCNRITSYSIYCKNGHLTPLDTGLINEDVLLYVSGYMKAIYNDDPSTTEGVWFKDLGPINGWFISGFDGGTEPFIEIDTGFGEYYLSNSPSEEYAPVMRSLFEKMYLTKFLIEFLTDETEPTYEDLINKLTIYVPPPGIEKYSEESLFKHAHFLINQVNDYDQSAESDEPLLMVAPCMLALLALTGVTIGTKGVRVRRVRKNAVKKKITFTKATTTKLVKDLFVNFLPGQMNKDDDIIPNPRNRKCGICSNCTQKDCGTCTACKGMKKFGGTGKGKQACLARRCPNMAIEDTQATSDPEDENDSEKTTENGKKSPTPEPRVIDFSKMMKKRKNMAWIGDPVKKKDDRIVYSAANISGVLFKPGEFIHVDLVDSKICPVAKISYLFEMDGVQMIHGQWFVYGKDTVLGETADKYELFMINDCSDIPFSAISAKIRVEHLRIPEDWRMLGASDREFKKASEKNIFFYHLTYDEAHARFEKIRSVIQLNERFDDFCPSCCAKGEIMFRKTALVDERLEEISPRKVTYGIVKFDDNTYRLGECLYLKPSSVNFKRKLSDLLAKPLKPIPKDYDKEMYPELYRKASGSSKASKYNFPEPFAIGCIKEIFAKTNANRPQSDDIFITVNKLYRPHNTANGLERMRESDLNLLYWSDEECTLQFKSNVAGKCFVTYSENLIDEPDKCEKWTVGGPNRFYFRDAYDEKSGTLVDVSRRGCSVGAIPKNKGKSKFSSKEARPRLEKPDEYPVLARKLKTLDVFAGCGGMSYGFEESGVSETKWAIEYVDVAASAYKRNFPGATVFTCNCNDLLKKVLNGEETDDLGQQLPKKGEVDMLCGGPPCQGFSGMNRFNSRQNSVFQNSLVASYLSYCDYYRPKFFVMENVKNFVSFDKSLFLKLTLSCLVRMGYQCTFGILQAGSFGVPQTRRRVIILAASPEETLPSFPEPTHSFPEPACISNANVDGKKYTTNCKWTNSAPYRTINVRDAMSDLPKITNGWSNTEIDYQDDTSSHFQRMARANSNKLRDHICKEMSALVEARISRIPLDVGSDWRDLPNSIVTMRDGKLTKKLIYQYSDKKSNRKNKRDSLKGVCSCVEGKSCIIEPHDNTLIPWCLPHSANRHNNWSGLYGRLDWDGVCRTTITNPEPMGKQGQVLHPCDHRVVSVRECARSQGFKDAFVFYGNIVDKHRQIGNAVPPPMARAIGIEIARCASEVDDLEL